MISQTPRRNPRLYSHRVELLLTDRQRDALRAIAAEQGCSMRAWLRRCIEQAAINRAKGRN